MQVFVNNYCKLILAIIIFVWKRQIYFMIAENQLNHGKKQIILNEYSGGLL